MNDKHEDLVNRLRKDAEEKPKKRTGCDVSFKLTHNGQRGEVFVDGVQMLFVKAVTLSASVGAAAVVTLELYAENITVDVDGLGKISEDLKQTSHHLEALEKFK